MGVYQQSSRTPQNGVNGSRKIAPPKRSLRMRRRVKIVLFVYGKTDGLQNKLVQSEGLFGRLVNTQNR